MSEKEKKIIKCSWPIMVRVGQHERKFMNAFIFKFRVMRQLNKFNDNQLKLIKDCITKVVEERKKKKGILK